MVAALVASVLELSCGGADDGGGGVSGSITYFN